MARKITDKKLKIPGLFFDNESWVEASKYPNFQVFTDRCLAEVLRVSSMRVQTWRTTNVIPFKMSGNYAVYDVNAVIEALKLAGYVQDPNLKSVKQ